jgi:hypothetical protein
MDQAVDGPSVETAGEPGTGSSWWRDGETRRSGGEVWSLSEVEKGSMREER